jgi:F-type H+-transporting ATPase subunit a
MILFFSFIVLFLLFINFSINANKIRFLFVLKIFIEIKIISNFLIKLILIMLVFLFLNYNSYIYYSVGLTMNYGYVFIYAFSLVFFLWLLWIVNNIYSMLRHFLPMGIEGVLKLFIPVLELIGVLIRPLTLAIRLATNISCGHVVLLIFRFFAFNIANYLVLSIRVLLFGLYFIEFLVCAIQAYVFWSLIYIYIIEIEI